MAHIEWGQLAYTNDSGMDETPDGRTVANRELNVHDDILDDSRHNQIQVESNSESHKKQDETECTFYEALSPLKVGTPSVNTRLGAEFARKPSRRESEEFTHLS